MGEKVTIERVDQVAVLRLANPPRNFLGPLVRSQLSKKLRELDADPGVSAIVLSGHPLGFSEGYFQVRPELRDGRVSLADLCLQIEDCATPVIASLTGSVLGAGVELALSAHARVAQSGTRLGMTDIALGIIPGAGGTQRLPRLVGAQTALSLLLSGEVVEVSDPRLASVIDQIAPENVEQVAIAFAKELAGRTRGPRKTRDRDDGFRQPVAYQEAIKACRMAMGPQTRPAQHAIIRSVENALVLPFLAGQAMEEDLYQESLSSEDAQGNLHLLLAQRRILKLPESATAKPQKVNRLGIVGSGPAAISLVIAAAENALPTILFERDARAAKVAQERLEAALTTRKAPVGGWPAAMQHVSVTYDPAQLVESDLVTEAVADAAETKQQVMRWLADLVPAATILATHSATLAVGPTAEASGRAGQVVGMAVAPGAPRLRLAEIIPGDKTSPVAVLTLHNLLQRMGVSALRCGSHGGTIGMRMMAALRDAADYLLDLGASCGQVDGVLMQFGKANGVFAPMDMNGLETELAQASQLHHADHYPRRHLARLRDLIAEQRTGQAAGKGYYDWVDEAPVDRARDADGTQTPDTETITRLCLGAMINEGARLLREGVALRPSDIDLVMVRNHGFAAWRGGVMNAADQMGLFTLQRAMKPHGEAEPRLFAADPGIEALIRNGEGFDALNGTGPKKRSFDA